MVEDSYDTSSNSMYFIAYGYWEENQDWGLWLEKKFLEESRWTYFEESKRAVQEKK
jgi:hypothetical protein